MHTPRRTGARALAATCLFALTVLACAVVRDSAASASEGSAQHRQHPSRSLLGGLGSVVTKLGHGVDSVLTGVGVALGGTSGHQHPSAPTSPPAPPTHASSPPGAAPPGSTPRTSAPATTPPATASPATTVPVRPAPADPVPAVQTSAYAAPAVPKPSAGTSHRAFHPSAMRSVPPTRHTQGHLNTSVASSEPDGDGLPGLDITAALAALMLATTLAAGLIVYRAGIRGTRAR